MVGISVFFTNDAKLPAGKIQKVAGMLFIDVF
jgi:hypothetical protein